MRRYFAVLLFLLACFITLAEGVWAQTSTPTPLPTQSSDVNVKVTINGFLLTLSGYLAPYASITLVSNGNVFASTVADPNGNFTFSSVRVAKGFTSFCLDGIDYKRLGESEACFTIPPVTGAYSKSGIFLPPTLGVFRANVNVGDKALVFGYGMPGAHIKVHLDNSVACEKNADSGGYYECNILISKEGDHKVYADATLNNKPSEPQLKRVLIKGIALVKQVTPVVPRVPAISFGLPEFLIALFLLLLLIVALIVILRRFKPKWIPAVPVPNPVVVYKHIFHALFRDRRLHHYWMKGVGF